MLGLGLGLGIGLGLLLFIFMYFAYSKTQELTRYKQLLSEAEKKARDIGNKV